MSVQYLYKFSNLLELHNNYEKSRIEVAQTVPARDSLRRPDAGVFLYNLTAKSAFNID